MPRKPLVSIILPAYNAAQYLTEAVNSLLRQTMSDFELIVVDDCSQDRTPTILRQLARQDSRLIVIRNQQNLKLSGSLNVGIAAARGKYLARMDADDWSYPDRLAKQLALLESQPEVGICGGSMEVCNENLQPRGRRQYHLTDREIRRHLFRYSPFCHPAVMIRTAALRQAGLYRGEFNPAEDYELYFRLGRVAAFANLPDTLIKYRVIPNSMTTGGLRQMEAQTLRIRRLYGAAYHWSLLDRAYTWLHDLSLHLVPTSWRFVVFNFLRNQR